MTNSVSFPGISDKVFTLNRVAFTIFGRDIMWYGVIIATGFALAAIYAVRHAKDYGLDPDFILDLLIYGLPSAIVGARIYYVIHQWDYYSQDLSRILDIRQGGLGFYGGFIAAFLVGYILCRKKKQPVKPTMDIASLGFILAQSVGRWGNFMNCEAHGGPTALPWGMSINGGTPVHPTFFYESLWNAIGFVIISRYSKKRRFDGEIFLLYMAWYGFGRMIIEGLRTDSLYINGTGIRVSQLVAGLSFIICFSTWAYKIKTGKYTPRMTQQKEEENK